MPRGYPDYQSSREPAIALQEVWRDDFESPNLKWGATSSAGSANPILTTTRAWKGAQSVDFAIVAGAAEFSLMRKLCPVLHLGRIGIEFFLHLRQFLTAEMVLRVNIYDGVNISQAELWLDAIARTATIVTPAGNIIVATNCINTAAQLVFTPFKLVVDMVTGRYVKLLSSPDDIDLSAHALVPGALTPNRVIDVSFSLESAAGNAASASIDDYALTQNEP